MDTAKDTTMQPATDAVIEELRELAEDLHVNGYNRYASAMSQAADELEQLRAKVSEMEKQEPVAWMHETRRNSDVVTDAVKHVWGKVAVGSMAAYSIPLYVLPGAKGE